MVVGVLKLIYNNRRRLPGRIKCQRLIRRDGFDVEVVEKIPLALAWCLGRRMCNYSMSTNVCYNTAVLSHSPLAMATRCDRCCWPPSMLAARPVREYTAILWMPRCKCSFKSSPSKQKNCPLSTMMPISSGSQPGVAQSRRWSLLVIAAVSINTPGTLWMVLRVASV